SRRGAYCARRSSNGTSSAFFGGSAMTSEAGGCDCERRRRCGLRRVPSGSAADRNEKRAPLPRLGPGNRPPTRGTTHGFRPARVRQRALKVNLQARPEQSWQEDTRRRSFRQGQEKIARINNVLTLGSRSLAKPGRAGPYCSEMDTRSRLLRLINYLRLIYRGTLATKASGARKCAPHRRLLREARADPNRIVRFGPRRQRPACLLKLEANPRSDAPLVDAAVEDERRVTMTGDGLDGGVGETATATAVDRRDVPRATVAVDDELDVDPALLAGDERLGRVDERRGFDERGRA